MPTPSPIKLYDTYLKRDFKLFHNQSAVPDTVQMYSCGPTVYGYQSIGNMRAVWLPDTVALVAKLAGWKVRWVLNITDVGHLVGDGDVGEDKMEQAALRDKQTVEEVVIHYTEDYQAQCKALNFDLPMGFYNPRATQYIEEQMLLALQLLKDKYAYITADGIYFDYQQFVAEQGSKAEGALAAILDRDARGQGNRAFTDRAIEGTTKHPNDFAVWKFVDPKSLQQWKLSSYTRVLELLALAELDKTEHDRIADLPGCPGWHSECVCMIVGTLGHKDESRDELTPNYYKQFQGARAVIDLHFGGEDHIDIHHKNEILQSAGLGIALSQYWIHNKFVMVDGKKMSKSLGNVYQVVGDTTVTGFETIASKKIDPLSYRVMLMEHLYTEQLNFTWRKLESSRARLNNLRKLSSAIISFAESQSLPVETYDHTNDTLLAPLLNGLNTPLALEQYAQLLSETVDRISKDKVLSTLDYSRVVFWDKEYFKLDLFSPIDLKIVDLVAKRKEAKIAKDYVAADKYRDEIAAHTMGLDDYAWGTGVRRLA
jgi:cysteinyl-tRNA synthetase